jgi:hypothetical protein
MPGTPTPILGLTVPTVGGDNNTWGTECNANWSIIDFLGAQGVFPVSSAFIVVAGPQMERFYRVTTGGLNVPGTLPDPGTIPPGKVFNVMVADVGGQITLSCVNPAVTIQGSATYLLTNQFASVRLLANGVNYDVIAVV